jgi:hypothetical protein
MSLSRTARTRIIVLETITEDYFCQDDLLRSVLILKDAGGKVSYKYWEFST